MPLPLELLQEVTLHLISRSCPNPPRRPPISYVEEQKEDKDAVNSISQLWRASSTHPVRRMSQVCRSLRPFVQSHMWQVVYLQDDTSMRSIELLFRYLRCVQGDALARWTQELTYSSWASNWDESPAPGNLVELLYGNSDQWTEEDEEGEDVFPIDEHGFLVVEEDGALLDWPPNKRFFDFNKTIAEIWAMHRFVFQQLQKAERICWRSEIDPGTMWRGSSLMHVISALPKLRSYAIDQSYWGGCHYARNLLPLTHIDELWIDCDVSLHAGEPGEDEWLGCLGQPTIDGAEYEPEVDHYKRFLTTCSLTKLVTSHFQGFDDAEVIAALACIDVVAREPDPELPRCGDHRPEPEDLELGQAAASLRPALLTLAAPGKLTAQHVRTAASSEPQLARIRDLLEEAAEDVARRFNAPHVSAL